jgi:hypothetical protein
MTVNISAQFTKKTRDRNGLEAIEKAILADPETRHIVVAVVEPKFSKRDFADGSETPTVRVVAIEALAGEQAVEARKMLEDAYVVRTGRQTLPFEDDEGATE